MAATESQPRSIFSERLQSLMAEVLAGNAPNAGRFCGYCYNPLAKRAAVCDHCGRSATDWPPVRRIPDEVLAIFRGQRSREGWAVRGIAYGGLLMGVALGLLPIALFEATWWSIVALFAILGFFYVAAANVANSLGDALGYRWGQRLLRGRWQAFVATRDAGADD